MAMSDSDDSNLLNEPGNEVCDIINCVATYYEKGASGNAFLCKETVPSTGCKESEDAQSFERNVKKQTNNKTKR